MHRCHSPLFFTLFLLFILFLATPVLSSSSQNEISFRVKGTTWQEGGGVGGRDVEEVKSIHPQVVEPVGFRHLDSFNGSNLFAVILPNDTATSHLLANDLDKRSDFKNGYGNWPIRILDIRASSRYEAGYAIGKLTAKEALQNIHNFLARMIPFDVEQDALFCFLDWQWSSYLSIHCPKDFLEELRGIRDGGNAIGCADMDKFASRFITLANFPSDPEDIIYILERELQEEKNKDVPKHVNIDLLKKVLRKVKAIQCDMFGVWGNRTVDGELYASRNLDWSKDTGIQVNKLITVYHLPNVHPYATIGHAGFLGALAGMNNQGLTAHQDNLANSDVTFNGFPWPYRLRYVLERASNLAEVNQIFNETLNTVGVVHGFGSAQDVAAGNPHAFRVFECFADFTSAFYDNEPSERASMWTDPWTGKQYRIGFPLKQALFRSNHPLGAEAFPTQPIDSYSPTSDSVHRYMLMHNAFVNYEQAGIAIQETQALNVTAILGQKGPDYFTCPNNDDGENIMSIVFRPKLLRAFVAYETGTGAEWRTASCSPYVKFEFKQWF